MRADKPVGTAVVPIQVVRALDLSPADIARWMELRTAGKASEYLFAMQDGGRIITLLDQFDAKRWTDVSGGRFKDVVITQEIIDQSVAVSSVLSPYVASAGGKLRLRMSVSG